MELKTNLSLLISEESQLLLDLVWRLMTFHLKHLSFSHRISHCILQCDSSLYQYWKHLQLQNIFHPRFCKQLGHLQFRQFRLEGKNIVLFHFQEHQHY